MITDLAIADLGVIDAAQLELHPGLTVVTGETGAGKTMVVTGLGLLLGGRADRAAVRVGAERARVEGRFTSLAPTLAERVHEHGGELEDEDGDEPGELLVTRQLSASGRSRCWLGGAQVTANQCAEVASELIAIHGQSEQVRLQRADRQRELLDTAAGAGLAEVLEDYRGCWSHRREVERELTRLREEAMARAREIDLLTFGLDEIEVVDPQPQEDAQLAAEAARLQAVDELRASARTALVALAGDEESLEPVDALGRTQLARKALAELSATDPSTSGLLERATEAEALLADLAADVSTHLDRLEADPARLEAVMQRMALLGGLTRKYGSDVDQVLVWSQQSAARLTELQGSDARIGELETELQAAEQRLAELGARLSGLRAVAAEELATRCVAELTALAMPHARLRFELSPLEEPGPHGLEAVQLLFSANPGSEPGPLGKVASGGELSRVRLALEVVMALGRDDDGALPASRPTLVFDEVDAGVGGRVAVEIGRRLAVLARHAQVVVVTHLAQVAAFADRHFVVAKSDDGQVTTSGVHRVESTERAAELARMMAGLESSETSLAHARELLELAGQGR
ncbi:DNA repair protein RecN [Auraticoccus monumenti]|uniref:DNA repair protein RecN n=1 Tax=Auraticoccus monumenti TaxID=675864 RepID=A0A1G7CXE3_9ACTN|nr:DNA repair protein RecN [Auraticoccus monumenti]SDE43336.1 DNA repair protein RecN (Recombination protein N) [Auraticoccus monumenti]